MRLLYLFFAVFFIAPLCLVQAQAPVYSLPLGFQADCGKLIALPDSGWVSIVWTDSIGWGISTQSLHYVRFNKNGRLVAYKKLSLPKSEKYEVANLIGLPDGSVMIRYLVGPCDVFSLPGGFARIDTTGNFVWLKEYMTAPIPDAFYRGPDGAILGYSSGNLYEIDIATGEQDNGIFYDPVNGHSYTFIPGTENFIRYANGKFQLWRKTGLSYVLDEEVAFAQSPRHLHMLNGQQGIFWNDNAKRFELLNVGFNLTITPSLIVLNPLSKLLTFQIADNGNRLIFLTQTQGVYEIQQYAPTGQLLGKAPLSTNLVSPTCMVEANGIIAIAGKDITGLSQKQGSGFGFRLYQPDPGSLPDAGLLQVQQRSPVGVVPYTRPRFPPNLYDMKGGNWQVLVKNYGSSVLNKVQVNVWADRNYHVDVCLLLPGQRQLYDSLALAPGDSIWLDFGDIVAAGQEVLPERLCFWTSSPDETPDGNRSNDHLCVPYYTSSTIEARQNDLLLDIFPNPANDYIQLQLPENPGCHVAFRHLTTGLTERTLWLPDGNLLKVPVSELPSGVYVLTALYRQQVVARRKLVIRH